MNLLHQVLFRAETNNNAENLELVQPVAVIYTEQFSPFTQFNLNSRAVLRPYGQLQGRR